MTTYPRTERSRIPAAVAAVIAAVVEENPSAGPDTVGRLAAAELSREGWHWHLGHEVLCAPQRSSRDRCRTAASPTPPPPATR